MTLQGACQAFVDSRARTASAKSSTPFIGSTKKCEAKATRLPIAWRYGLSSAEDASADTLCSEKDTSGQRSVPKAGPYELPSSYDGR
jgi:hypothetical protein